MPLACPSQVLPVLVLILLIVLAMEFSLSHLALVIRIAEHPVGSRNWSEISHWDLVFHQFSFDGSFGFNRTSVLTVHKSTRGEFGIGFVMTEKWNDRKTEHDVDGLNCVVSIFLSNHFSVKINFAVYIFLACCAGLAFAGYKLVCLANEPPKTYGSRKSKR